MLSWIRERMFTQIQLALLYSLRNETGKHRRRIMKRSLAFAAALVFLAFSTFPVLAEGEKTAVTQPPVQGGAAGAGPQKMCPGMMGPCSKVCQDFDKKLTEVSGLIQEAKKQGDAKIKLDSTIEALEALVQAMQAKNRDCPMMKPGVQGMMGPGDRHGMVNP